MRTDRLRKLPRKKIKKEVSKMVRKLTVISLVIGLCLMGITSALAQKVYPTLAEYEKLTGKRIERFSDAPMLKVKVAAGELPPVEERLPEEPLVMEPVEEIGEYGGRVKYASLNPRSGPAWKGRFQNLFRRSPINLSIVPNIAKGWDLSKDYKILTVHLRRGMKWSDGAPFTADDVMFWYEDILLNDELTPVKPMNLSPGKELVKVEKVNDYTVNFKFGVPYPIVIDLFAFFDAVPFAPEHYLKKYHIKYNPGANEIAKKEGYDYWWLCFPFHQERVAQQDVNLPRLEPWTLKKIDSFGNKYFERNPYYFKVDAAGNQLPYIDEEAMVLVENREVLELKAIAGEFSVLGVYAKLKDYPLYKEGEKKGGYHTMLVKNPRGEYGLCFNQTHKDPVLRKIFTEIRFKQAMSLAINREEINDIFFFGKALPYQAAVMPDTSFYEDWMGKYYAEYDPEKANRLLDEADLKWDKNHQYRLRSDGKTLAVTIEYGLAEVGKLKIAELIKDYWQKVGVKTAVKQIPSSFYRTRAKANELDIGDWALGQFTEIAMHRSPFRFRPPWTGNSSGTPWYNWYATGGKTGEEPPEEIKKLFELCDEFPSTLPGTEEYRKIGKEIVTRNLKGLYTIGTVALSPWPLIVKDNLRNILKGEIYFIHDYGQWGIFEWDQWFFKK